MDVHVLGGPLVDGQPLGARERRILAALALRVGRTVAPDELADAAWGEAPPETWRKQVQSAVGELRRHPGVPPIATAGGGYRLDDAVLDADRFTALVDAATAHAAAGEADAAAASFADALGCWSGAPYADLPDWAPARIEAARLDELRSDAEEGLVRARLDCGEAERAAAEAERLVRLKPTWERRWQLLALARYRCGRQVDALAALREARATLADELGIDPSPELLALETAILRHDPALDAAAPAHRAPTRSGIRPDRVRLGPHGRR